MWMIWMALGMATPIEVVHQGRLLDVAGAPQNGTVELDVRLIGPEGEAHFESFGPVTLNDGFYAVTLGTESELDSSVFLAPPLSIELIIDDVALPPMPFVSTGHAGAADLTDRIQVVAGPLEGTCALGQIRWDRSADALRVCVDGVWRSTSTTAGSTVVSDGTTRRWSDGTVASSCAEYASPPAGYAYSGDIGPGRYQVDPGSGETAVYCAMNDGNYTLKAGSTVNGQASLINGGCPADFIPFQVSTAQRVAAANAYVSWSRASTWWWANVYAGPDASCSSTDLLVGTLTASTWTQAPYDVATVMPNLTLTNNCNQNQFDPVPLHVDDGFRNRGCATCLYNATEQSEPGRVVCAVVE